MHTNKDILKQFFTSIIHVMAYGSSDKYAVVILKKFIKDRKKKYSFIKHIDLDSISENAKTIKIDKEVDEVDKEIIGKFISELIDNLFSDLFKHLLSRQLKPSLLVELKYLGVDMKY